MLLFGDGAGAVLLGPAEGNAGVLASRLYSDGSGADALIVRAGGVRTPLRDSPDIHGRRQVYINGRTQGLQFCRTGQYRTV